MELLAHSEPRERRTQSEKSLAMRERLLAATVECLVELGYSRTTTIEVIERAQVSRGAMLHHYPSRAELLTAVLTHLADAQIAELRASVADFEPGPDMVADAIDVLWANFSSPSSYALLELIVAARTDRELHAHLQPLIAKYEAIVAETARELFSAFAPSPEFFEIGRRAIYYLMHGLAVTQIVRADDAEANLMLDALKQQSVAIARAAYAGAPAVALPKPMRRKGKSK
jgi:AcrR family transcriptional regulator